MASTRFNKILTMADVQKALLTLDAEPRLLDTALAPAGTGAVAVRDPASLQGSGVGGRLHTLITYAPTTGTSEQVLDSYTLPIDGVPGDNSGLFIHAAFFGATNTNSKTARIRLGGVSGAEIVAVTTTTIDDVLVLQARLWRASVVAYQAYFFAYTLAGVDQATAGFGAAAWDEAQDVVATAETGTAAGDLALGQFEVTYIP